MMSVLRYREHGGPEKLKVEMVGIPKPGPLEALVRVRFGGLNFADWLSLAGRYPMAPKPPAVLGLEGAGEVEAVGPGVEGAAKGARVAFLHPGAFAEFVLVPAAQLLPLPGALDFETAAALMVQGLTAWGLTRHGDPVLPGETVVVHSAAGGVGHLAAQLCKAAGAAVVGTVSSEKKTAAAREAGCASVVVRGQGGFADEALRLSQGRGAGLVLDAVGKDTLAEDLRALGPFGRVLFYGAASGAPGPVSIEALWQGSKSVGAFSLLDFRADAARARAAFESLAALALQGALKVHIGGVYPLQEAPAALKLLGDGGSVGKLLLKIG